MDERGPASTTSEVREPSLWTETAPVAARPTLAGDVRADVAIVGAGVTGMALGLELQRSGLTVVVLEQAQIGAGTSGRSTAKVSALHALAYDRISSLHGDDAAAAFARLNERGLERIARLDVDCDLRRRASYTYATTSGELEQIKSEMEAARRAGLAVELVEELPLPWAVAGAIRLGDQAEIHPQKLLRGLADALEQAGGRIYERTRVTAIDDGKPCMVTTKRGTITADHVVVATRYPFGVRGLFFARLRPERSYALAVRTTEPPPEGMFISVGSPTRSLRAQPVGDGEVLIVGGEGHKVGHGGSTADRYHTLEQFARRHWTVEAIPHRWSAHDCISPDGLPYIGSMSPGARRIWVATAYDKWGFATSFGATELLRDAIAGGEHPSARFFDPSRRPPAGGIKRIAKENVDVAARFVGDRLLSRGDATRALAAGEGRVVSHHGRQLAVSRDDNGVVRAVSARCTHLGCIVTFNDAERSWDCPCHGARFALDGSVLEGPALEPLEERETPLPAPAPGVEGSLRFRRFRHG